MLTKLKSIPGRANEMDRPIYIIDAKRTAIGKFLGALYESDPRDVCVQVIEKGFKEEQIRDVESVIIGNVISAGTGQAAARNIAINAGIPLTSPAYTLNEVCGSGMQAIINGINEIKCGKNLVLCGGFEFMSNIPFCTDTYMRLGKKFGDFKMIDLMTRDGLLDSFSGVHMGITAENIAKEYHITREEQDDYSILAQRRAIEAVDSRCFDDEIVPVTLTDYRGRENTFDTDEFPNRASTREKLATLKPSFLKDGTGTVTAGNSSGINDGAAFILLASKAYCERHSIKPIAKIVGNAVVGCDPQKMGLGPYYAISRLLEDCGISLKDVDYMEINEAFAAQILGCLKLLSQKYGSSIEALIDKCNLYGSGLGLGHPLGATGTRIVVTLSHIVKKNNLMHGIASLCIGGGMGAALLLERVDKNEFA